MKPLAQPVRMLILLPALFIACWQPAYSQKKSQSIDPIEQQLLKQHFNGTILVAKHGKIVFQKQLGYANMAFNVPISEHTKFELASLTKPFTALLVLQLVQQGKLHLDDKLTTYFPEVTRPEAQAITLRHMLSHTSGIQDYVGISPEFASWTDKKVVEELSKTPISFVAGTQFQYASSTYILLRILLERATGKTFEQLLTEQILTVAGMHDTGVVHNQAVIKGKATGYIRTEQGFKEAYPILNSDLFLGAASIYSTAADLLKWDQALASGKLLTADYQTLMYTPVQIPYGYGWFIDETAQGAKTVSHGGDTYGHTSLLKRQLASQTVLIILSNVQSVDREAVSKVLKDVL